MKNTRLALISFYVILVLVLIINSKYLFIIIHSKLAHIINGIRNENDIPFIHQLYASGYYRQNAQLCPSFGVNLTLLILVASAPQNIEVRKAIRLTWGIKRRGVSIAFVLGYPPKEIKGDLDEENNLHKDLIMGNFVDSFENLTLKTYSMLEWVNTYCDKAKLVLKIDEDVFIDINKLLKFVDANLKETKTIWGTLVYNQKPFRKETDKYFVTKAEYPLEVYPNYTAGAAYLMTVDAIKPLLKAGFEEKYFKIEDVFFTGVLAERLSIKRIHAWNFCGNFSDCTEIRLTSLSDFNDWFLQWNLYQGLVTTTRKASRWWRRLSRPFMFNY